MPGIELLGQLKNANKKIRKGGKHANIEKTNSRNNGDKMRQGPTTTSNRVNKEDLCKTVRKNPEVTDISNVEGT